MMLVKSLILAIGLAIAIQGLYTDKLSNQDIFTISALAMAVYSAINLAWPSDITEPKSIPLPTPRAEESAMMQQVQANDDQNLMRRIMRKLFSDCAFRSKIYMNSYLSNHIDRQIWHKLLVESKQQIGEVLGNPQVTEAMLHHLGEKEEVLSALYSENASRVKASVERLHKSADNLTQALSTLGSDPTETRRQIRELDELFIQMALARLEQNWLRDAKLFTRYYDGVLKMADNTAKLIA